jgi:hypothetical protein
VASVTKGFVSGLLLRQSDTAEALADREESILPGNVVGSCKGVLLPQVVEVLSSYECLRLIACSKPNLRAMCLVQIIGCLGATHLRRDPARLQCIREDARPTPCDTKGEEHIMQLRVGEGLLSSPMREPSMSGPQGTDRRFGEAWS